MIWIILCSGCSLLMGWINQSKILGIMLLPLLLAPYAYVFCHTRAAIFCMSLFGLLVILQSIRLFFLHKSRMYVVKNRRPGINKRKKIGAACLLTIFSLLVWASFLGANAVISTLLVPDFMEQLEVFEQVTEQSYSQMIHTDDITLNRRAIATVTSIWQEQVEGEDVSVQSRDGYQLNGKVFRTHSDTHQWVLLAHGYTGWKEAMYPFACWYWKQGVSCLVPDLRCSGSSEGDYIGLGYLDRQDLLLWIDVILQLDPQAQILLHGQSMGAAAVVELSALDTLPDCVKGLISDCAYSDAYTMFQIRAAGWLGIDQLPDWCLEFICITFRLRGGYNLHDASPISHISNTRIPALIIHGDQDRMIPVKMAYDLYDTLQTDKELWIVQGAGHAQSQDKDPTGYFGHVKEFISRVMPIE